MVTNWDFVERGVSVVMISGWVVVNMGEGIVCLVMERVGLEILEVEKVIDFVFSELNGGPVVVTVGLSIERVVNKLDIVSSSSEVVTGPDVDPCEVDWENVIDEYVVGSSVLPIVVVDTVGKFVGNDVIGNWVVAKN